MICHACRAAGLEVSAGRASRAESLHSKCAGGCDCQHQPSTVLAGPLPEHPDPGPEVAVGIFLE